MAERNFLAEVKATFGYQGPYNYDAIIEDAVTDCRSYEPVHKIHGEVSDATLKEQLGWMEVTRTEPATLSGRTLMEWANRNSALVSHGHPPIDGFSFSVEALEFYLHIKGLMCVPRVQAQIDAGRRLLEPTA